MSSVTSEPPRSEPAPEAEDLEIDVAGDLAPVYAAAIRTLRVGFLTGAALMVVGLVLALIKREALRTEAEAFDEIIPALRDGKASAVIDLAILALMATPVVTVVVVALGFFRAKDRAYGLLSLVVLGILGVSIVMSFLR